MKLLKSKFILGALALAAVVAFASPSYAAITSTLKVGSRGAQVTELQNDLKVSPATGYFGPITKAAVIAFQKANGLTADGIVGAHTIAALGGSSSSTTTTTTTTTTSYPAGCASAMGFSATTGLACNGVVTSNLPAGCTSAMGFSPTTGQSCGTSVTTVLPAGCTSAAGFSSTTGVSCSTGTTSTSGGEGTLSLQSPPIALTTNVAQGDVGDAVFAVGVKAMDSNISINRFNVNLAPVTNADLPWNYFSSLQLYQDGNLIGTLPVNSTSLTQNTFGKSYTAIFSGLNANIAAGAVSNFVVKASIVGTLPASANNNNWVVGFFSGYNSDATNSVVRGTDGMGLSQYLNAVGTYNGTSLSGATYSQVLIFFTTGTGGLQVSTDSSNPIGNNVVEQTNQTATGVTALVFDLKNTSNNSATIESINASVAYTSSTNPYVTAYYLYNGGTMIASTGNPGSGTLAFTNFSPFVVAPNSTTVMTIKFDAGLAASGTVQVSVNNTGVVALLNNSLSSNNVTGSATGNSFVLIGSNGVSVSLASAPVFTSYPSTQGVTGYTTGTFVFNVSPVGVDLVDPSQLDAVTAYGNNVTDANGTLASDSFNSVDDGTYLAGASAAATSYDYIVSPVITNGISDGNTSQITIVAHKANTGTGTNVTFSITGLRFAKTGWTFAAGMTKNTSSALLGNSVGVTGGLTNFTVTGYTNN